MRDEKGEYLDEARNFSIEQEIDSLDRQLHRQFRSVKSQQTLRKVQQIVQKSRAGRRF
jgi:hypothetical protein